MYKERRISRQSSLGLGKALKRLVFAAILLLMLILPTASVMAMTAEEIQNRINSAESGAEISIDLQGIVRHDKPFYIDDPITINFSNGSIMGNWFESRVFEINSDKVTLNFDNVTLAKQHNGNAGAHIWIDANYVTITGGRFEEGTSNDEGGSIYIDGEHVTIKDATFVNCRVDDNEDGGAIYVADTDVTIEDCTFEDCHADCNGGAIALHSGTNDNLEIKNCTFKECSAGKKGHWVYGAGDTKIINCTPAADDNSYNDCEMVAVASAAIGKDDNSEAEAANKASSEEIEEAEIVENTEAGDVAADEEVANGEDVESGDVAADEGAVEEEAAEEENEEAENTGEEESVSEEYDTGSVLSGGQSGIVIAVAVLAIVVIVALVIVKKKRKSEK